MSATYLLHALFKPASVKHSSQSIPAVALALKAAVIARLLTASTSLLE
jgi:hypothetical protein